MTNGKCVPNDLCQVTCNAIYAQTGEKNATLKSTNFNNLNTFIFSSWGRVERGEYTIFSVTLNHVIRVHTFLFVSNLKFIAANENLIQYSAINIWCSHITESVINLSRVFSVFFRSNSENWNKSPKQYSSGMGLTLWRWVELDIFFSYFSFEMSN